MKKSYFSYALTTSFFGLVFTLQTALMGMDFAYLGYSEEIILLRIFGTVSNFFRRHL